VQLRPEAFTYVVMASLGRDMDESRNGAYLLKLQRIRTALGIRVAELARLLRVSREAIRKWEAGEPISEQWWSIIDQLSAAVDALMRFIKPEHLPSVVRRPVPGLNNATPLEWLASHRFEELIAFYQRVFSYESTA
jgi:transcriptional regulator with XRE-family HTH domain